MKLIMFQTLLQVFLQFFAGNCSSSHPDEVTDMVELNSKLLAPCFSFRVSSAQHQHNTTGTLDISLIKTIELQGG